MDCQTAYTLTDLYTKDNDIDGVEKVLQHRLDNIPVYPGVKEPIHDEDFDAWEEIIGMLGRLRAPWLYEEDEEEETHVGCSFTYYDDGIDWCAPGDDSGDFVLVK